MRKSQYQIDLETRAKEIETESLRIRMVANNVIRQATSANLERRLRRSERWADTLFWITIALLFGNIALLWAQFN